MTEDILEKEFTIADLPKFSPWPHRLLGLIPFEQKQKLHQELLREFEDEKWGPILRATEKSPTHATIQEINDSLFSSRPKYQLITINNKIKASTPQKSRDLTLDAITQVLLRYLPAESLVELGAGFGDMFVDIAQHPEFKNMKLFAGEFTESGRKLLNLLCRNSELKCTVGECDFNQNPILNFAIPKQALVFTVTATMYIPKLQNYFIEKLLESEPKCVVHLEPCYEHLDNSDMLGALCQKYFKLNDYNRNLLSLIKRYESNGNIEILEEKPSVIGPNPFLPLSVIVWRPKV